MEQHGCLLYIIFLTLSSEVATFSAQSFKWKIHLIILPGYSGREHSAHLLHINYLQLSQIYLGYYKQVAQFSSILHELPNKTRNMSLANLKKCQNIAKCNLSKLITGRILTWNINKNDETLFYCCKEVNYGVRLFRYFRKVFDDDIAKFWWN